MSNLYIVATPIGNLKDITDRAKNIFSEVDVILCEDTRVSQKLLAYLNISKTLISYHQHSKLNKVDQIIALLKDGKNIALISDAGTPGISDPGNMLVKEVSDKLSEVKIIPIPGASAMISIASVSGFSMDRFIFMGFPPVKNKRQKYFKEMLSYNMPVIFYESCHRILKTLNDLQLLDSDADIVVGRELTKQFETIHRGKILSVIEKLKHDTIKGEFSIVIKPSKNL
jgi:16S rRNA (cytidine1402-2'-O)-methyltransferase